MGLVNAREIIAADPATVLPLMPHDRAGDVVAIERVTRRLQSREPIAGRMRLLLIGHVLQRPTEIALHEDLAHRWRLAIGQEDRGGARPVLEAVLPRRDLLGEERIGRKPVARETDRRCRDLTE